MVGIDNLSKYGKVTKSYDDHPAYTFVEGDARDVELMTELLADCDHFIAGAAMIGGISYFHTYAYDLLATNERIIAASCDAAIEAHRQSRLQEGHLPVLVDGLRIDAYAGPRSRVRSARVPPPLSSYGFQKLAVEYFATRRVRPVRPALTPSSARSTAWASASDGRSATSRSCRGT